MALITTNRLFIDVEKNRAYSQFGTYNITSEPFFIQGDQCPIEVSLVRQTGVDGNPFEQVPFDAGSSFDLKIGTTTAVATQTSVAVTPSAPSAVCTNPLPYSAGSWEVYRVEITPKPAGGFFTVGSSPYVTKPLSVNATALEVLQAITAWGGLFTNDNVLVSKVGQYAWEISFQCNAFGYGVMLTASGTGLLAYDSRVLTLDMTTAGVATLLAGKASASATLDFSVTVSGETQTFLYTPCTVINDI